MPEVEKNSFLACFWGGGLVNLEVVVSVSYVVTSHVFGMQGWFHVNDCRLRNVGTDMKFV